MSSITGWIFTLLVAIVETRAANKSQHCTCKSAPVPKKTCSGCTCNQSCAHVCIRAACAIVFLHVQLLLRLRFLHVQFACAIGCVEVCTCRVAHAIVFARASLTAQVAAARANIVLLHVQTLCLLLFIFLVNETCSHTFFQDDTPRKICPFPKSTEQKR